MSPYLWPHAALAAALIGMAGVLLSGACSVLTTARYWPRILQPIPATIGTEMVKVSEGAMGLAGWLAGEDLG